ncbi:MAG: HEPN domain-containing protein [Candidatus Thiodiazotropha endolucinida]|nr:HEPN domain-containing protein [Candidatus Thiodiazotropha taylori]MCW4262000.1 HEPN domain-containing protein [Candidatus Thiodiazotropha endolucinida]
MGLVKQIWMEEQELQPMYEWIEDNYGEDLDQDDEEEWQEAVDAYEAYVEELQMQEAIEHAAEEYDYYIYLTLKDADKIFSEDLSNLKQFVLNANSEVPNIFYKMAYAHAVTVFEVYMEDIAKSLVTHDDGFLHAYIRHSNAVGSVQFSLKDVLIKKDEIDVSLKIDNLRKSALSHLSSGLYHDIPKVLNTFEYILQRQVSIESGDMKKIVHIRHDIVHRNGKNKNGDHHDIDMSSVIEAIDAIQQFSQELRSEIAQFHD